MSDNIENPDVPSSPKIEFKKPILFGKIGKLPKKSKAEPSATEEKKDEEKNENTTEGHSKSSLPPAVLLKELSIPIPYKEPKWSGFCPEGSDYALEVLKSGMIMEKIDLTKKAFYVFGRLANCDVVMAHPTISRHHAVLQYKAFANDDEPASGWYLFDLGSTHGTFLNRDRIKEQHYTRVRVGHQIKFGSSTRTYIVLGPDFDADGESELTVTEIRQRALNMKLERDRMIREAIEQRERDRVEEERRREEQGIDWGMGEDADDEPDLSENPYACTANEELFLDDPKKTLRGYFEREGLELVYDCDERGIGQFLCRVELPLDDARGRPLVAEVLHKGKKKEAVVACALEACRILDRAGLLRQAKHESRRKKQRDWSADDYYDSDDDTFLDRTGSVEKKRQARMEKNGLKDTEKPLTYEDLLKQITDIENKIASEEKILEALRVKSKQSELVDHEEDALDEFMNTLHTGHSMAHKAEISKAKMSIQKLKTDLSKTRRLCELARPADAPPLLKKDSTPAIKQTHAVTYGKRIRLKDDKPKPKIIKQSKREEEFVEEMDSDEDSESKPTPIVETESKSDSPVRRDSDGTVAVETKKLYGPMRPPENYVVPENYYDEATDRDLPEIEEGVE
ncbi:putative smad nuclear interacting protein [Danaus plexippus plexippus]|uniref:Smad nuclear interacting protein n=1 Tax=Danaus plexippus plexippus TaxID=278856 RepID=A0A212FJS5_DANPL|nr:putative smad nuclear interacting protein [Danaus plexippus plexippus]